MSDPKESESIDFNGYSQSRMSPFDEYALHKLLKSFNSNKLRILEIGSWLGAGSTQIFSNYARNIVCVDHWLGNENKEHKDIVSQIDPYLIFQENIKGFKDRVVAMRCDSSAIGELLADDIFDFIFIDGDHRYSQTLSDIKNCLPKLKTNGIISGHDCEGRLTQENEELILSKLEEDHIDSCFSKFTHMHPGVIKAVNETLVDAELFADDKNKLVLKDGREGYSTIWYKKQSG